MFKWPLEVYFGRPESDVIVLFLPIIIGSYCTLLKFPFDAKLKLFAF